VSAHRAPAEALLELGIVFIIAFALVVNHWQVLIDPGAALPACRAAKVSGL
jgi:hypothetical protein